MHPAHRVPFDFSMYVINLTSWRRTLPTCYTRIPHREHRPTPLQRPTGCCYREIFSCLQSHTKHKSKTYGKMSISLMLHQVYFSIVKQTICTIFRVYWKSLYMFRTVFPSIIRSSMYISYRLVDCMLACPVACSQLTCMTYTWCCMYSLELLMMDGKTVRNM